MARNSLRSQHKRSLAQETQTRWMRGFRHYRPSQGEVEAFRFADPSPDTRGMYRLERRAFKEKKDRLNGERREKRTNERLRGLKGR